MIDRWAKALLPGRCYRRWFQPSFHDALRQELSCSGRRRFRFHLKVAGLLAASLLLWVREWDWRGKRGASMRNWRVSMNHEMRYALRRLAAAPLFSASAVLILALGIGANAGVFAGFNAVVLSPLPYPEPGRLVVVNSSNPSRDLARGPLSYPDYLDLRESADSLQALACYGPYGVRLKDPAEQVPAVVANAELFRVLGVQPLHGRVYDENDPPQVAVVSHEVWKRRFGADPSVAGRTVQLDGEPFRILGVMPPEFRFPTRLVGFWIPLRILGSLEEDGRRARWLHVAGRLADGASLEQASGELAAVARALRVIHPESNAGWGLGIEPLHEAVVGKMKEPLALLQGGSLLLLALAMANVALLFLARYQASVGELSLRRALGANLRHLIARAGSEAFVLCFLGAVLGCLLARLGAGFVLAMAPPDIEAGRFDHAGGHAFARFGEISIGWQAVGAAFILALLAGAALAFVPLALDRAGGLARRLVGGRLTAPTRETRLTPMLVGLQFALSLLLVSNALALGLGIQRLGAVDTGFDAQGVLTFQVSLGDYRDPSRRAQVAARLEEELAAIPEVGQAGFTTHLPFSGVNWIRLVGIAGEDKAPINLPQAIYHAASPGYFRAMRIGLLQGRILQPGDRAGSRPVAVVNQAFTDRYLDGRQALGSRIYFPRNPGRVYEIVGVVESTLQESLQGEARPEVYVPFQQQPAYFLYVALRTRGDPEALAEAARRRLSAIDSRLAMSNLAPLGRRVSRTFASQRLLQILANLFSLAALASAAAGIYGLVALRASRRRREIGVRLALGARPSGILRLELGRSVLSAAAGLALGLPAAALSLQALSRLLRQDGAEIWLLTIVAGVGLFLLAILAALLPATRASRLDPSRVLRSE